MKTTWLSNAYIYQINLRSLCFREPRNAIEALNETGIDSSPLDYLCDNLDALKTLGVNVLHLMPPFEMGLLHRKGIGSPYAARNYTAVDPEYGTIEQLKALIQKAHQLDLKVIIGMVPNHTSRDNVWIESNPEYYVHNDQGDIIYDLDWSDTAKLDYTNPGLRNAMMDVYDFWLSLPGPNGLPDGVDGFRIDMAHFINDRTFWDDTIPRLRQKHADKELLFLAECYGIDNSMDLFQRGFNASYDDAFYKMLEHYYGTDPEGQSITFSPDFHPENTTHSPFWSVFEKGGLSAAVRQLLTDYEALLPTAPHPVFMARYADNHDEGRGIYRFGLPAVQAMTQLLFATNHCIPFQLTGQEFGAANRPSIHNRFGLCDKGRQVVSGSNIARQEGIEFEGNSFVRTHAARQELMQFYRTLIAWRKAHSALQTGTFHWLEIDEEGPAPGHTLLAFERRDEKESIRCIVNLGHAPKRFRNTTLFTGEPQRGTIPPFAFFSCT
ncbi:MAG: alpha-amylase family glycosyl hydrolase [Kiritimatiellae bacterium]|nr:alpha-amylase family glycosyl hydrolase [Kiritimatiellia bacterium]